MKKTLSLISIAVLILGLLGSCSKSDERIDELDQRIGNIENDKILSIQQQIDAINASIADLSAIKKDITDLQAAVGDKAEEISKLKVADEALGQKIDDLKAYVGDLSRYAEKDWANATFATLEKQAEIIADVSKLKTELTSLDEKLDKSIKNLESSLKSWVNEQLSAYYKKAEMDAKLKSLQDEIAGLKTSGEADKTKIAELETSLTKLKADLEAAKSIIKTEYEAAIAKAISDNNGTITQTIQTEIDEVNASITALTGRVETLETTVRDLTGRIDAIEQMIQDITIIPAYSDGSVKVVTDTLEDGSRFYHMLLDLSIDPISAAGNLKKEDFTIYMTKVQTKSASDVEKLAPDKILECDVDKETGIVSIKADVFEYATSDYSYCVAVHVKIKHNDSLTSTFTSDFVKVNLPPKVCVLWENSDPENNSVRGWGIPFTFVLKGSPGDRQKADGTNDYVAAFDANQWSGLKKCLYVEFKNNKANPSVTIATSSWDYPYGDKSWNPNDHWREIEWENGVATKWLWILNIEADGNLLRDPSNNIENNGLMFNGDGYTLLRLYYIR